MRIKLLLSLCFFVIALSPFFNTVYAQGFIFTIPLKLTDIHSDVKSFTVGCRILSPTRSAVLSQKSYPMPSDGSVKLTIQIGINPETGINLADYEKYFCQIVITNAAGTVRKFVTETSGQCSIPANQWYCVKPGTAYNSLVSGTLP